MSTTKHEVLRLQLRTLIDHDLGPHDRLPTERDLAERFQVSRVTVRRALADLQYQRRVYRVQGAGTFVSATPIAKTLALTSFSDDMLGRGLVPGSTLLQVEVVAAGAEVGLPLDISPADDVVRLQRIRTADGAPMCLERVHLPLSLVPGLPRVDLSGSLYEVLQRDYRIRIVRADQSIRATVVDQEVGRLLQVPPFTPALLVERTGYDERDRPVERASSLYRADRYSFEMTLQRTSSADGASAR